MNSLIDLVECPIVKMVLSILPAEVLPIKIIDDLSFELSEDQDCSIN